MANFQERYYLVDKRSGAKLSVVMNSFDNYDLVKDYNYDNCARFGEFHKDSLESMLAFLKKANINGYSFSNPGLNVFDLEDLKIVKEVFSTEDIDFLVEYDYSSEEYVKITLAK